MNDFLDRVKQYPLPPLFGLFLSWMLYRGLEWYYALETPSEWQTACIGGLVAGVIGFMKYYCELLGAKWASGS
jgi:hypothetical protein